PNRKTRAIRLALVVAGPLASLALRLQWRCRHRLGLGIVDGRVSSLLLLHGLSSFLGSESSAASAARSRRAARSTSKRAERRSVFRRVRWAATLHFGEHVRAERLFDVRGTPHWAQRFPVEGVTHAVGAPGGGVSGAFTRRS